MFAGNVARRVGIVGAHPIDQKAIAFEEIPTMSLMAQLASLLLDDVLEIQGGEVARCVPKGPFPEHVQIFHGLGDIAQLKIGLGPRYISLGEPEDDDVPPSLGA